MKAAMKRSFLAGMLAMLCIPSALPAQQQEPSLAEAARRARERKKDAPKAVRVWTNDNLPSSPGAPPPSVVPAAGTPEAAASPSGGTPTGGALPVADERQRAAGQAELAKEKENLERAKKELDLLQRDYDLRRQQFYSNPGYASDSAGKAALDGLAAQVDAKRREIGQIQQRIAGLEVQQESLNRVLGPEKQEPPTADQQRASFAARLGPLREELARVEAEIRRMRENAAAQGLSLYGNTVGGSMTAQLLQQLENRRTELQRKIADIEDEARRAGVPVS